MPPHITMWSYLWDLVDDGIDDVLAEMRDDLGLTALSLATHYHSVEQYRPHTKGPFIYRADSSLYFEPDLSRYGRTRMRHQVAPLAQKGNPLKRVSDRAAEIGLDLVSWTLACHSSYLGRTYPECVTHNATGDVHPEALCPANPDVRGFLTGLADDLTHNYRIAVLELESWHYQPSRHYHHHEKLPAPFGPAEEFLLGLCFCEHCAARGSAAGVDVDRLRASVADAIRRVMSNSKPFPDKPGEFIDRTPGMREYVEARVDVVNSLLEEIVAASASPVSPICWSSPETSGVDVSQVARIAPTITITAYASDEAKVRQSIREAAKTAGGVDKLRVGYHAFPPVAPDRETLLRNIAASLDEGVRAFSFYNYGVAPRPCLQWVRDAARMIHQRT